MKYQNTATDEIKTYSELKSFLGGSVPKAGKPIIAGIWRLLEKGVEPVPDNAITHGVREIDPVEFVRQYEVYELPTESQESNQLEADVLAAEEIDRNFVSEIRTALAGFTPEEQRMFPELKEEALAWDADPAAVTIMIDAVISESGEDKAGYVAKIIENIVPLKVASGKALGKKRLASI